MFKQKLFNILPNLFQNFLISILNFRNNKKRFGVIYKSFLYEFKNNNNLSLKELKEIQKKKFEFLVRNSIQKSSFYKRIYSEIKNPEKIKNLTNLPILKKDLLKANIDDIITINYNQGIISKTGGTTGKSMQVLFTKQDFQQRFAALDNFRSNFGYRLGKKTAWFSGKSFISEKDVKKGIFWKTDYFHNIRYYSTFHIKNSFLNSYLKDLIRYRPEYMSGFPSSIADLARHGNKNSFDFPKGVVKAIFTTSETLTDDMRLSIETFFKAKIYNQYSASEGAPFIFECPKNNLHLDLQSGVFEVLDNNDKPTNSGRLIVTSFTSKGTPLIRYDIGDSIELSNKSCKCGNNNPIIKKILGREDDFLYSHENGKMNLVNLANSIKDVKGLMKTQFVQNDLNKIIINLVVNNNKFDAYQKSIFLKNIRLRLGEKINIQLNLMDNIPNTKSGKFRFVINNIKNHIPTNE
tara:strand:+ start:766 stop:2154 length:1389 start_codon:yes stop_codon:yes gene_type:complete